MNKKLILICAGVFAVLGIGGYFVQNIVSKKDVFTGDMLFSIDGQSLTVPEFEEFVKVGEEASGTYDLQRAQKYYYMLWQNKAIHAWNKKHRIDQLPEYKKDLKVSQEWLKKNPDQLLTNRKDIIENQLKCMILIECWWRDIDNNYFIRNFPLFKSDIEKKQLSFDKFGSLSGQMILDLVKELKTVENSEYFASKGIKGIEHLLHEIRHPEERPKVYQFAVTNSTFMNMDVTVYGTNDAVLSQIGIPAAEKLSEMASAPTNTFEIPIFFENEEQKKSGVQKIVVAALGAAGEILQKKMVTIKEKQRQGDFQIMIDNPRPEEGSAEGDLFHVSVL